MRNMKLLKIQTLASYNELSKRFSPTLACSPDGNKVWVTGRRGELWIYLLRTQKLEQMVANKYCSGCSTPVFSGDGKRAVTASWGDDHDPTKRWIHVWNLNTYQTEVQIELGDISPDWEPEVDISSGGKFLVATRNGQFVHV
eukprot:CAMPEP_0198604322 /NCGR_PEP_ID=MMETSP1462-20131121/153050_1 /TAXON_ID=1333877 /ORGANISM="Brandtodinium nutriculum, Strain RCC3387" /LENGTH=141 /DNA_ID=CAMNT_0044336109 /DNA_START=19 /DNA_END=441 /DNA_ORIENTATION=-